MKKAENGVFCRNGGAFRRFPCRHFRALLGGKGFYAMIPVRVIKNLAMIPIESAILYVVLNAASRALGRAGYFRTRR